MVIALVVVISLVVIIAVASFFLMKKTYEFKIDDQSVIIKNSGSNVKIIINNQVDSITYYPNLINGERITFKVKDKEYFAYCKSSKLGFKLRVEIYQGETFIDDNKVEIKEKQKVKKQEKKETKLDVKNKQSKIVAKKDKNDNDTKEN